MRKIGCSAMGEITPELLKAFAEAGVECSEVSQAASTYGDIDHKAIRRMADEVGIEWWSYHLPFGTGLDLSSEDPEERKSALQIYKDLIAKATDIGITRFVVHPSKELYESMDRRAHMEAAKESFVKMADIGEEYGGVILVEDLPRFCLCRDAAEMKELLSVDDRLRVVFDTNHLLSEDPVYFIRELGDKIVSLHVSDYDNVNERHWIPGEGVIDWQAVIAALDEVGYTGPWMYEVGWKEQNTILRDRLITPADLVKNAHELFAGQKPTRFSKPKPGLGFWE